MKGINMIRKDEIERTSIFLEDCLKKVIRELDYLKKKVPEGATLRAAKHDNTFQYFIKTSESGKNGKYLCRNNRRQAEILAQIEYDKKLVIILRKQLSCMKKYGEVFCGDPFALAINKMAYGKRDLVKMPYESNDNYVISWLNQEYKGMSFGEGFPEYYTRRGLRVRSKSEVIIADMLDELAVPFLYEKPLNMGGLTVHPDFTLLNLNERKEVYWEHFGMMDDIEYRNNAFSKIQRYELYGHYQYSSVIWTFETSVIPLNTRSIRKMIIDLRKSLGYENS